MKRVVLAAMFVVMASATSARAASFDVQFDPDGAGGASSLLVSQFDWAVGNSVIISNPTNPLSFTVLYQANLSVIVTSDEDDVDPSNGTFGKFYTAVAGFEVLVDTVNSTSSNTVFLFDPASSPNFFNVYADAESGNNLTGLGFAADAGSTLILSGSAIGTGFSSNFNVTAGADTDNNGSPDRNLDQFGGNNYPGVYSVLGTGATALQIKLNYWDPLYFLNMVDGQMLSFTNTSQVDPYNQANPSNTFSADGVADGGACGVPCVGVVNGGYLLDGDPNSDRIVAQTDGNSSFAVVPEPASLLLLGAGILGVAALQRRRMAAVKQ